MAGDETDVRLAKMRRAMGKLSRQGRHAEFEAVAAAYANLKRRHMELAEVEHKAEVRVRKGAPTAEEVAAAERAEEDRRWAKTLAMIGRGGSGMRARIWTPGR